MSETKKYLITIALPIMALTMGGCNNHAEIEEKIRLMQSQPIHIEFSNVMMHVGKDSASSMISESIPYHMVVYSGAEECSTCAVNSLSDWNTLMRLEEVGKMQLVFVFAPHEADRESVIRAYHSSGMEHSIWIDTCNVFRKTNTCIPEEGIYHVFMVDQKKNVVLVGTPLKSEKIKEVMMRIIK